jgi:hypothetical protein
VHGPSRCETWLHRRPAQPSTRRRSPPTISTSPPSTPLGPLTTAATGRRETPLSSCPWMRPACSPKVLPRRWPPREPGSVSTVSTRHTVNPPMGSPSTGSNRVRPSALSTAAAGQPCMARPNTVSWPTDRRRHPEERRRQGLPLRPHRRPAIVGVIVAVVLLARFATKVQEDPSIIFPSPEEAGVPVPSTSRHRHRPRTRHRKRLSRPRRCRPVISEAKTRDDARAQPLGLREHDCGLARQEPDGLPVMFDLVFSTATPNSRPRSALWVRISTHQGHLPPGLEDAGATKVRATTF